MGFNDWVAVATESRRTRDVEGAEGGTADWRFFEDLDCFLCGSPL